MGWQQQMRDELEAMTPTQAMVACGEWITDMNQRLLPELASRRRAAILAAFEADPDMDAATFAETIGSRPGTIARLASEARTERRRREGKGEALAEDSTPA